MLEIAEYEGGNTPSFYNTQTQHQTHQEIETSRQVGIYTLSTVCGKEQSFTRSDWMVC